jgi:DUF971 family protein
MADPERFRPVHVVPFPNGELGIVWGDGHESFYPGHLLRCACSCALCVDEGTGRKTLRDEMVPRDVRPLDARPVGRYGIGIRWSDGHGTGIYALDRLRGLCPCAACATARA